MGRVRKKDLRVPVFPEEEQAIRDKARQAGMSVAMYLRSVAQGYPIKSVVDLDKVDDLMQLNADLGRLGGLLKLWLTDDRRLGHFGPKEIRLLLGQIGDTRRKIDLKVDAVVRPQSRLCRESRSDADLAAKTAAATSWL